MTGEYRVDIKVRNNIILYKIEQAGYASVNQFCKAHQLQPGSLGDIIAMKVSPLMWDGEFKPVIQKTADILGCAPLDLFSDTQMHTILKDNHRHIAVNEAEMKFMLDNTDQKLLEDHVLQDECNEAVGKTLNSLSPREQKVINMRYGLGEYSREHTLEEVAAEISHHYSLGVGMSKERIRQIEVKALRKMRHPDRAEKLREFVNTE
jgi:RNA polymerase sigma factor (sigma-70 family)